MIKLSHSLSFSLRCHKSEGSVEIVELQGAVREYLNLFQVVQSKIDEILFLAEMQGLQKLQKVVQYFGFSDLRIGVVADQAHNLLQGLVGSINDSTILCYHHSFQIY